MDVLLKKYFWVITLAVVGLCAGFFGRAASHIIEQTWLTPDESVAQPTFHRSFQPIVDKTRTKDVEEIVRRDVFCSNCAPITPSGDNPSGPTGPADDTPRKTDLQLELVSTMVVQEDEQWSMAVIRDTGSKDKEPSLYRKGSSLPGGAAKVLRVVDRKVYLANNNRVEYLELEGGPTAVSTQPLVAMASPQPSGDPLDAEINKGVRCNGAQCEIDRPLIDKLLANTTLLATAARFVPSIKDGKPNGFKLYAIRPNSIFGKIGLQNGDTVKAINGMEMSSPDQALGVYTKVRSASHLTVSVERRGETVTLDYTIR